MTGSAHSLGICQGRLSGYALGALLLSGWLATGSLSASDTLHIAEGRFGYDPVLGLLLVAMDGDEATALLDGTVSTLDAGQPFSFVEPQQQIVTGIPYEGIDSLGGRLDIYFTPLPLVQVHSFIPIVDEPKVPGLFTMWSGDSLIRDYSIGVEYRGGYSQNYAKKSLLIEFRKADDYDETRNVELLGMRSDDDWNLQAMYVERLRLRNVVANEIWMDMHQPYYAWLEPKARSGVRHQYVELFINGSYAGLYAVGERVDRKQLQVKETSNVLRGEIFKGVEWGVPTLDNLPPPYETGTQEWAGFVGIYPKDGSAWGDLYGFVDFVTGSSDTQFREEVDWRFLRSNAIDYFLFMNALFALDNTGKNIHIARYDAYEPFFYVPWDLDATMGRDWLGIPIDGVSGGILSNGLYDRWLQDTGEGGFLDHLCQRWNVLRGGILTTMGIMDRYREKHDRLKATGAYEREALAWPDFTYDPGELAYMTGWLDGRLTYLDGVISEYCTLLGEDELSAGPLFRLFPNPATDRVTITLDREWLPAEATVFNAVGQVVRRSTLTRPNSVITVGDLPPGVYPLQVTSSTQRVVRNLLVVE